MYEVIYRKDELMSWNDDGTRSIKFSTKRSAEAFIHVCCNGAKDVELKEV